MTTVDNYQKIAEMFRKGREKTGLPIKSIVERTKIKKDYIEAMEAGNMSVFENPIFIRNFVRSYARFLKIPESQIMPLLAETQPVDTVQDRPGEDFDAAPKEPVTDADTHTDGQAEGSFAAGPWILLGAAVVGIIIYTRMENTTTRTTASRDERPVHSLVPAYDAPALPAADTVTSVGAGSGISETSAPSAPVSVPTAPAVPTVAPSPETQAPESRKPEDGIHRAELIATAQVWLMWETEKTLSEMVMQASERRTLNFQKSIRLRIGNSAGIKILIDGSPVTIETTQKVYDGTFQVTDDGRILSMPTRRTAQPRAQ